MKNYIFSLIVITLLPFVSNAQETIKGTVIGADGDPLPGATIRVLDSRKGAIADMEGKYVLMNVMMDDVLEFAYIGYESQMITVGRKTEINVYMMRELNQLDEVIVIGYGTSKKKDITGAVGSVDANELAVVATANYDEALMGRVAGVLVTAKEGTPGEALNITIRGGNSITSSNQPLYVVDGIPLTYFDPATLNTNDIKEFTILKDASATAIYGSRGANGVIVITTKNGDSEGETKVTLNASYGMQEPLGYLTVLNPYEYVRYREKQLWSSLGWERTSANENQYKNFYNAWGDPAFYHNGNGHDWQDSIYRQAPIQRYNLSVNGGNEKTNFYYSGNYTDQKGTLITTGFKKINNNLRVEHKTSKKGKFIIGLLHSYNERIGPSLRGNQRSSIVRDAVRFRPADPLLDDSALPGGYDPTDPDQVTMYPPKPNLENTEVKNIQNVFRGNTAFVYDFNDKLKLRLSANYQGSLQKETLFYGEQTLAGQNSSMGIQSKAINVSSNNLASSNTLTYKNTIGRHSYSMMGGVEGSYYGRTENSFSNGGFPVDDFGVNNMGIATIATIATSDWTGNTMMSYFGRATYSFGDKYLLTANFRADGSSKFRKGNQWGFFPSLAAAWRLGDEPFIKRMYFFSHLKLRGGWGITGNNRIADFAAFNTIAVSKWTSYNWGSSINYVPGAIQSNMAVPDLRWETTHQSNFGVDMGFMDDKLEVMIDFYQKNTTDLLLNASMATSTGFQRVTQNVGEVQNRGLEFSLTTANIHKGLFKWSTNFNISFNRNEVIRLNQGEKELYARGIFSEDNYITRVGETVGMMYGLQFDGLYQNSDFNWDNTSQSYVLKEGVVSNGNTKIAPGGIKFVDQNGDGIINEEDRVIIGNPNPKHFGGFTNRLSYKGFDLNVMFQWSVGFDVMNGNAVEMNKAWGVQAFNTSTGVADMWTPYNSDTEYHTSSYEGVTGGARVGNEIHSQIIEDGSYLRLKTVTLSYTLPQSMLERMHIKGMTFSITGQNLYTWTNYSGVDPEVGVAGNGLTPNLDYSAYPPSRTYMGSINLTF
ncbi:TonB-dependent receptor [Flammeovirga sp. EKP202]|uniref:SusC/RagA family TonB-linked outer membrane protein n=1 Tax=Flammeovirga sp. EKP202 TaxID=2770592 RepID=UPI00165FD617|nr:TonB-dependent receptor [Flammeovirga sp. EKP202]MBD0401957.1 TonB-dependent receptor [Flammeovirga sp. EKP202]